MCSLAGISSQISNGHETTIGMSLSKALAHRGPDGHGQFHSGCLSLYHRRLAVIDPQGGQQPFVSKTGNALILNGMIYNYRELKTKLPEVKFQTDCDAELPLYLYQKYGDGFTTHLRGMYALALYDAQKETLILARDPYGIKPLYYNAGLEQFTFASEPQALLKAGAVMPELHEAKAVELLQLKFTTGRQTAFKGIERVLPGETIMIKHGKIVSSTRRQAFLSDEIAAVSKQQALERLDSYLRETVKLYTQSDAGFGVFLSGGVDSCSIMAALKAEKIADFPCYTACFPDEKLHDEVRIAQNIARAANARHITLPIHASDFWDTLAKLVAHVDDPTLDPAMIANFLLAERASQDVKVVLGGDGGDEIFAGYRRYERANLPGFIKMKPLRASGQFDNTRLLKSTSDNWRQGFAISENIARRITQTRLQFLQATDGADFLPHFHLMKLDRCLMAHGVEGRVPFLDQKLAKFGYHLPDKLKLRGRKGKYVLRHWLNNTLPEARAFSRKRGFSTPVNSWITDKAPSLRHYICDQPGIRELFEIDKVNDLFLFPDHPHGNLRWAVLFFAMWHDTHILQKRPVIF